MLLACGMAAGPLYLVVAAGQMVRREGFDIRVHAVSLLSNGELGWIQIANFVIVGVLTVAGAVGLARSWRRMDAGSTGSSRRDRAAWSLGVYGMGLILAGVFVADPSFGFPVGTPAGPPDTVSWQGVGHLVAGGVGFLAFVTACGVYARRFAAQGRAAWATVSAATGAGFLAAFVGLASGAGGALNVVFAVAVVIAWGWFTALTAWTRRHCG